MAELLTRKRQIAAVVETTSGTYQSSSPDMDLDAEAKDFAEFLVRSPSFTPAAQIFDRNIVTGTLTRTDQFAPGVTSAELAFGMELSGHSDTVTGLSTVEPPLFRILSACGFRSDVVRGHAATDPWTPADGVMIHGETVNGSPSGNSAVMHGDVLDDENEKVYTRNETGSLSGDTLTGAISGQVIPLTGRDGSTSYGLSPNSAPANANTLSVNYYADGKRWKLKGCAGTSEWTFEHANVPLVNITLSCIIEDVDDSSLLTGANKPFLLTHPPLPSLGSAFSILPQDGAGGTVLDPTYNSLSVQNNQTVTLRENSADTDGWSFAAVTGRAMTLRANWDEVLNATFDFHTDHKVGTVRALRWNVGLVTQIGQNFFFRVPAAQIASLTEGDRDNVTVWEAEYTLRSGFWTDQVAPTKRIIGKDNEFIVITR